MSRRGVWRTLGIDQTTDLAAIRRAYAQALRAMDPDADPDGFARLRTARDTALASARDTRQDEIAVANGPPPEGLALSPDPLAPPLVPGDATGVLSVAIAPAPIGPISDARPDSGVGAPLALPAAGLDPPLCEGAAGDVAACAAPADARVDAAYGDVVAILHGEHLDADHPWLDEAAEQRLIAAIGVLLADPRMAQITFSEDAARWFADVLADAIPRSDPVLDMVAAHFGWNRDVGTLGLSDAATRVAERARSLDYIRRVRMPDHDDHHLWTELTRPAYERSRRSLFIRKRRMQRYLAMIRHRYPDAERCFDTMRVALWEPASVSGPNRWLWGFLAFMFLRALLAFWHDDGRAPVVAPPLVVSRPTVVADRDRDINLALLDFADGFTLERVRAGNRRLADALEDRWRAAAASKRELEAFILDTRRYLAGRFGGAMLRAPYAEAAALRRMELTEWTRARNRGGTTCARLLAGDVPLEQIRSRDEDQYRHRIMASILIADPKGEPRQPGATFRISGEVMARLARETGLGRKALDAALDGRGLPMTRCDIRLKLLTIALALPPPTGLPLLRAM